MAKLNVQQPLLQSSVSHDHSEIIAKSSFGAQETFFLPQLKTVVQLNIFVEKVKVFFQDSLMYRMFKKQHLFEIEYNATIFCNMINEFTLTFYKFNAQYL